MNWVPGAPDQPSSGTSVEGKAVCESPKAPQVLTLGPGHGQGWDNGLPPASEKEKRIEPAQVTLRELQGCPGSHPPVRAAKWSQEKCLEPGSPGPGRSVGRVRGSSSSPSLSLELPMLPPESSLLCIWRLAWDPSAALSLACHACTECPSQGHAGTAGSPAWRGVV